MPNFIKQFDPLDDFSCSQFNKAKYEFSVYRKGEGPGTCALRIFFTGNFTLSLMVDPCVMAPVLSQPSLPIGFSKKTKSALHISKNKLAIIRQRTQQENISVLGLRFNHDMMSPAERFSCPKKNLGENFEAIEIDSGPNNPPNIPKTALSVLTLDLIDEAGLPTQLALQGVLDFFTEKFRFN